MHSPARFHFPTFGHLLFLLSKTRRVLLLFTVLQVERLDAYRQGTGFGSQQKM